MSASKTKNKHPCVQSDNHRFFPMGGGGNRNPSFLFFGITEVFFIFIRNSIPPQQPLILASA